VGRDELKQAFLGKAHDLISGDNAVVEQSHVELSEHFLETLGDELVRMRRLGYLAGMCVQGHYSSGVVGEDRASDLPRMYGCALRLAFSECL
jgi:hypothetical protein